MIVPPVTFDPKTIIAWYVFPASPASPFSPFAVAETPVSLPLIHQLPFSPISGVAPASPLALTPVSFPPMNQLPLAPIVGVSPSLPAAPVSPFSPCCP